MNDMITVQSAAQKWNITPRRVQILCTDGRIEGAVKKSGIWLIPSTTQKPMRQNKLSKNQTRKNNLNVLSLFSGCGGMDLGFEGDFEVLKSSINRQINEHWNVTQIDKDWVKLPKTRFRTIFANDIRGDAKAAWINFFHKKQKCFWAVFHEN